MTELKEGDTMTRTRKDVMLRRAKHLGLFVTTWTRGDGATRYRFSRKDEDYFALGGNDSFTALGVREADAMLDGYVYGLGFVRAEVEGAR